MRVQAGLRAEDWLHWGRQTTFKRNAAELLARSLRSDQAIYCSPLTDPYQPAEAEALLMPGILRALVEAPAAPRIFVIQTRGPMILRDRDLLLQAGRRTRLRVSFSVTTDRDDVRRIFEPHCAAIEERWRTIEALRTAGVQVFATLAPILPCDPETLIAQALDHTSSPIIADPFHVRSVKRSGATTREAAIAICRHHGWDRWLDPDFQQSVLRRMQTIAQDGGRVFGHGTKGFGLLAGTFLPKPESYTVKQFRDLRDQRLLSQP
jgi:DNA repair photolyase